MVFKPDGASESVGDLVKSTYIFAVTPDLLSQHIHGCTWIWVSIVMLWTGAHNFSSCFSKLLGCDFSFFNAVCFFSIHSMSFFKGLFY